MHMVKSIVRVRMAGATPRPNVQIETTTDMTRLARNGGWFLVHAATSFAICAWIYLSAFANNVVSILLLVAFAWLAVSLFLAFRGRPSYLVGWFVVVVASVIVYRHLLSTELDRYGVDAIGRIDWVGYGRPVAGTSGRYVHFSYSVMGESYAGRMESDVLNQGDVVIFRCSQRNGELREFRRRVERAPGD